MRSAIRALGDVASNRHPDAMAMLFELAGDTNPPPRAINDVAVAVATVALRQPMFVIEWLLSAADDARARGLTLLREGFESLEEDFAEEQFYVAARDAYWAAAENSPTRTLAATLIDALEF
jgi:hypothetical protein